MSIYGVLADVHGNLAALDAVVRDLDRRGIKDVFCLGDLVGYCAEPNACVALARQRGFRALAGNHERIALGELDFDRCGLAPAHALRRTRQTLDDASRHYISALPPVLEHQGEAVFLHGTLDDVCEYMSNKARVLRERRTLAARYPSARVCFFGHTHVAKAYEIRGSDAFELAAHGSHHLHQGSTWFINPGSVDGSRAPEAVARFAIFDDVQHTVSFHAARYDHAGVERQARREGYRLARSTLAWHAGASFARSLAARVSR